MKKKIMISAIALSAVAVLTVGGTLAYFTDSDEAENVFTIGRVGGELTESEWIPGESGQNILPGDWVAKNPTVTIDQDSADVYVRFLVEFAYTDDNSSQFLESLDESKPYQIEEMEFYKLNDSGQYERVILEETGNPHEYYFIVPDSLSAGETYTLFDHVQIPHSWGNEVAGVQFAVKVKAEFVQADNFENLPESWKQLKF